MTVDVVTTAYGRAALTALGAVVADLKGTDRMARVTVIAPNNIAGMVARRHLAAGTPGRPGIAGIEVTTIARLAERIATPLLASRRPATRTVVAAAWRRALTQDPRGFQEIADHPATVRALAEAHTELRDVSPGARHAVSRSTPVGHDLVALHEDVVGALGNNWYDTTDVLHVATDHLDGTDLGACILYLPQDLDQSEAAFVKALGVNADLTVIAALTGVVRADAAVRHTLEQLGLMAETATPRSTASRVINASDADDEVRCVVRDLMTSLRTTPAHRVAVLYATARPYGRLLHEQLRQAHVVVNGAGVRPADERAVARTLREVLALADGDVPRADLFRALANAPVRDFGGGRIPLARWERLSRSAGIVAGDDWTARLDAYISDRRAQSADEAADVEPRQWMIDRLGRDIEAAEALATFVTRLRAELRLGRGITTWSGLISWCRQLFADLIGDAGDLTSLPVEEQYAATSVIGVLTGLLGLDDVETTASLETLRDILDTELAGALPRVGRFGEGVLVAPISAAIGLDLDVVYVVGLSEDLYPGRLRADALLPDRARDATGGELPSRRERLHTQQRQLLAAFACAPEVVASFPRGDLRRSSRRLPSRFLLPSLRELSGDHTLAATEWNGHPAAYATTLTTVGSFAGELLTTDALSTGQEWRTRATAAAGRLDDAAVTAATEMLRARAGDRFTRFDGNLTDVTGLPDYAVDERAISPTALESYSSCPHAFFMGRLLGVEPIDQPEDIVTISPMEIGNLVHGSLEILVAEFTTSLPGAGEPWTAAQHERLVAIAAERADEFRERGLTGHPRLWEPERDRVIDDVRWLLDDDDDWRAEHGAAVVASEMPFGLHGEAPVQVPIPGGRILMRGSADKVDRGADGSLYVTDLKTGSDRLFKGITEDDPFVGGTKLQLPVYGYAARQRYGNATTPVHATYWFVRRNRGRIGLDLTPEVEAGYAEVLRVIAGSIAHGLFPPKSPEQPDFAWTQCPYCNPDDIGHAENRERWERKRHDPALRELVTLIDPGVLAGPTT